jgi:hypothetical protein
LGTLTKKKKKKKKGKYVLVGIELGGGVHGGTLYYVIVKMYDKCMIQAGCWDMIFVVDDDILLRVDLVPTT